MIKLGIYSIPKRNIYFLIFILIAALATGVIIWYSKKTEVLPAPQNTTLPSEYSYEKVVYNFWGSVAAKEKGSVLVEGIISEPGKVTTDRTPKAVKFIITNNTRIVKLKTAEGKLTQLSADEAQIQIKDRLALKTDNIDTVKGEAIATDIVIMEPLPAMPTPPATTSSAFPASVCQKSN